MTDRLKAEEELRESEARFRSMADSVPALIWLSDLDGRRTYFNKTWLEFTGRTAEQQFGYGWADSVHPDDRDRYLAKYSAAFADAPAVRVGVPAPPARRRGPVGAGPRDAAVHPVGRVRGVRRAVSGRDRPARGGGAVRQSEAFRHSVFENSPDCLKIIDLDGRVLEMNEGGCRLMEVDDFADPRGRLWAELWPAANRETIREAVDAARAGRVGRFQGFCPTAKGTREVLGRVGRRDPVGAPERRTV